MKRSADATPIDVKLCSDCLYQNRLVLTERRPPYQHVVTFCALAPFLKGPVARADCGGKLWEQRK